MNFINIILDYIREKEKSFEGTLPDYVFDCILYLAVMDASDSYLLFLTHLFHLFFLFIYDNFNTATESNNINAKIFKTAVNYMNENTHLPLTVKQIAEKCCISMTGLKKIFLEYGGLSIHKYFLKLKINRAVGLLSKGKKFTWLLNF